MKRLAQSILGTAALALIAMPAFAAFEGPGVPSKEQKAVTQVSQVKDAADMSLCMLEGSITEQLKPKDSYMFKDASGSVVVRIGKRQFNQRTVTPETRIRLSGTVSAKPDKRGPEHDRPLMVDVDWFEIIR